jgi:hypothetical protein
MYLTYRQENRTLASIGIWQETDATVGDRGEPERVRALRVADGTLQALGVRPMRGRWFTEAEHSPAAEGAAPVILTTRTGNGVSAATRRSSGASFPSRDRAATARWRYRSHRRS